MIYVKTLVAYLKRIDRNKKKVVIKTLDADKLQLNIYNDTVKGGNIKFLSDALKQKDTTKTRWQIEILDINANNSQVCIASNKIHKKKYGIDFSNMVIGKLRFGLKNFRIEDGDLDFLIKEMSFIEKTGFKVYDIQAQTFIEKKKLSFKNVKIRTPNSFISNDFIIFNHKNYKEYSDFINNIKLDCDFNSSNIGFEDLAYFSSEKLKIPYNFILSGHIYGKVKWLKGKNVTFKIGEQTELVSDFNISGLPDINQTFIFFDFKKLTTTIKELEIINNFKKSGSKIIIPNNFDNLGIVNYHGNFSGFFNDFVAYGKLSTQLGNISTDISLKPKTNKELAFSGKLETEKFRIGELFNSKKVEQISFNAQINGSVSQSDGVNAKTKGEIESIVINDYNYQNIIIDGFLTRNTYNGYFNIDDPNVKIDFEGDIDFSEKIPVFNFKANIPKANLYGLNIDKTDSTSNLRFSLNANFQGENIDNIKGRILFSDACLTKLSDKLIVDSLLISSEQNADTHNIALRSDYIDANLFGSYQSKTLIKSVKKLLYNYLPAFNINYEDTLKGNYNNDFVFNVNFKDTKKIAKLFIPTLTVYDSSIVYCKYNSQLNQFQANASSKEIKFRNYKISNFFIKAISNDSVLSVKTKSSSLIINKLMAFENFNTTSVTANNSVGLLVDWDSNNAIENKGKIISNTTFIAKENKKIPEINIAFLPSKIIVRDSIWKIFQSNINIDSSAIKISNFKAIHNKQLFYVNGCVSDDVNDSLFFDFRNVEMANINVLIKGDAVKFEGLINGEANISNIYNNPLFYSDVKISNFYLNKKLIGDTKVTSNWDKNKEAIDINLTTKRGKLNVIVAKGDYIPKTKKIDFDINFDKVNLDILEPFLHKITKDITGIGSGKGKMTGTFKKPIFNGDIIAQETSFMIDYLQTSYSFTNKLIVKDNSIIFENINAFDAYSNKAIVNGHVDIPSFKNISYDFTINAKKIHALNTTGLDNNMFYGTAFMSGIVNINGVMSDMNINISGKTEKNTKINIPLSTTEEASESNFITFINSNNKKEAEKKYKVDLKGFKLNFDLEITPEAEAQLIFDSKIGDVIKANGNGNLKMSINSSGDFNMYGEYNIEDGDYLFTLQNVINKKFDVDRGSKILWNGDPYNANIDVKASYSLKAPLSGLLVDTTDFYKRRIPIDCQIFLTDNLMNPTINFNIELPSADEDTKTKLKSAINTQEKMNKQFLALLVINNFLPDPTYVSENPVAAYGTGSLGFGQVTTSELLSNQLSHWLSQISDEWDLGVNYRPGDEISQDQVEVALSTQLLNDRVTINGNVGYGQQKLQTQTSDIVGDFDVEIKLNESGKLRLKAFNKANDKLIYKESLYTQGVGLFYREEFSSLKELFKKIFKAKAKKEEKIVLP